MATTQPPPDPPHNSQRTSLSLSGEIPGSSPLRFCNESRDTDLFSIEQIELILNPLYMYATPPFILSDPTCCLLLLTGRHGAKVMMSSRFISTFRRSHIYLPNPARRAIN